MKVRRWVRGVAPVALVAIGIAGCGGTPGEDKPNQSSEEDTAAKVQTDGFEKLGNVTLRVVSSETGEGPKKAVRELSRGFEQKYPNVDVKVSYRPFETWIKQVKLELSGDNPPDVVPGNQGYQVDGDLVKAGLILPMDKYSDAYGWAESFSPESLQQFTWSEDGRTFGEGTLWGIAQSGQSTGVFANKEKMQAAGVDPAQLKTFADFEAALATLKTKASGDEPVIMLGNKEQYPLLHLWGMIQQAYTPAQQVRDWIFHKDGRDVRHAGQPPGAREAEGVDGRGLLRHRRQLQRPRASRTRRACSAAARACS